MKHGDKAKNKAAKAKTSGKKVSSKSSAKEKGGKASKAAGKKESSSPVKTPTAKKVASEKASPKASSKTVAGAKSSVKASRSEPEAITFTNPAIESAFKRAVKKFTSLLRVLHVFESGRFAGLSNGIGVDRFFEPLPKFLGDIDDGLQIFMDALEGPGAWKRLPATAKQLLRDNATTLIGQMKDQRPPFSRAGAEAVKTPTLFIGGANTKGTLPQVLHTLAANVKGSRTEMIPGATHPMFEQAPQKYCEIVLDFLAA